MLSGQVSSGGQFFLFPCPRFISRQRFIFLFQFFSCSRNNYFAVLGCFPGFSLSLDIFSPPRFISTSRLFSWSCNNYFAVMGCFPVFFSVSRPMFIPHLRFIVLPFFFSLSISPFHVPGCFPNPGLFPLPDFFPRSRNNYFAVLGCFPVFSLSLNISRPRFIPLSCILSLSISQSQVYFHVPGLFPVPGLCPLPGFSQSRSISPSLPPFLVPRLFPTTQFFIP